jgi:GGDEF domain-containing protein
MSPPPVSAVNSAGSAAGAALRGYSTWAGSLLGGTVTATPSEVGAGGKAQWTVTLRRPDGSSATTQVWLSKQFSAAQLAPGSAAKSALERINPPRGAAGGGSSASQRISGLTPGEQALARDGKSRTNDARYEANAVLGKWTQGQRTSLEQLPHDKGRLTDSGLNAELDKVARKYGFSEWKQLLSGAGRQALEARRSTPSPQPSAPRRGKQEDVNPPTIASVGAQASDGRALQGDLVFIGSTRQWALKGTTQLYRMPTSVQVQSQAVAYAKQQIEAGGWGQLRSLDPRYLGGSDRGKQTAQYLKALRQRVDIASAEVSDGAKVWAELANTRNNGQKAIDLVREGFGDDANSLAPFERTQSELTRIYDAVVQRRINTGEGQRRVQALMARHRADNQQRLARFGGNAESSATVAGTTAQLSSSIGSWVVGGKVYVETGGNSAAAGAAATGFSAGNRALQNGISWGVNSLANQLGQTSGGADKDLQRSSNPLTRERLQRDIGGALADGAQVFVGTKLGAVTMPVTSSLAAKFMPALRPLAQPVGQMMRPLAARAGGTLPGLQQTLAGGLSGAVVVPSLRWTGLASSSVDAKVTEMFVRDDLQQAQSKLQADHPKQRDTQLEQTRQQWQQAKKDWVARQRAEFERQVQALGSRVDPQRVQQVRQQQYELINDEAYARFEPGQRQALDSQRSQLEGRYQLQLGTLQDQQRTLAEQTERSIADQTSIALRSTPGDALVGLGGGMLVPSAVQKPGAPAGHIQWRAAPLLGEMALGGAQGAMDTLITSQVTGAPITASELSTTVLSNMVALPTTLEGSLRRTSAPPPAAANAAPSNDPPDTSTPARRGWLQRLRSGLRSLGETDHTTSLVNLFGPSERAPLGMTFDLPSEAKSIGGIEPLLNGEPAFTRENTLREDQRMAELTRARFGTRSPAFDAVKKTVQVVTKFGKRALISGAGVTVTLASANTFRNLIPESRITKFTSGSEELDKLIADPDYIKKNYFDPAGNATGDLWKYTPADKSKGPIYFRRPPLDIYESLFQQKVALQKQGLQKPGSIWSGETLPNGRNIMVEIRPPYRHGSQWVLQEFRGTRDDTNPFNSVSDRRLQFGGPEEGFHTSLTLSTFAGTRTGDNETTAHVQFDPLTLKPDFVDVRQQVTTRVAAASVKFSPVSLALDRYQNLTRPNTSPVTNLDIGAVAGYWVFGGRDRQLVKFDGKQVSTLSRVTGLVEPGVMYFPVTFAGKGPKGTSWSATPVRAYFEPQLYLGDSRLNWTGGSGKGGSFKPFNWVGPDIAVEFHTRGLMPNAISPTRWFEAAAKPQPESPPVAAQAELSKAAPSMSIGPYIAPRSTRGLPEMDVDPGDRRTGGKIIEPKTGTDLEDDSAAPRRARDLGLRSSDPRAPPDWDGINRIDTDPPDQSQNLTRSDLSSTDLRGLDLRGAVMHRADLSGSNLSGMDLTAVDLSSANLTGADLSGANLTAANLQGATLIRATFVGAKMERARLNESAAPLALFNGAQLVDANLSNALLRGAWLPHANLLRANLTGADLQGADLGHANLSAAKLIDTQLGKTSLRNVSLTAADIRGAEFYLPTLNLSPAQLQRVETDPRVLANLLRGNPPLQGLTLLKFDVSHTAKLVAPQLRTLPVLEQGGYLLVAVVPKGKGLPESTVLMSPTSNALWNGGQTPPGAEEKPQGSHRVLAQNDVFQALSKDAIVIGATLMPEPTSDGVADDKPRYRLSTQSWSVNRLIEGYLGTRLISPVIVDSSKPDLRPNDAYLPPEVSQPLAERLERDLRIQLTQVDGKPYASSGMPLPYPLDEPPRSVGAAAKPKAPRVTDWLPLASPSVPDAALRAYASVLSPRLRQALEAEPQPPARPPDIEAPTGLRADWARNVTQSVKTIEHARNVYFRERAAYYRSGVNPALANRRAFLDGLLQNTGHVVEFIEIPGVLKPINDHVGHVAADKLLAQVLDTAADVARQHPGVTVYQLDALRLAVEGSERDTTAFADAFEARVKQLELSYVANGMRYANKARGDAADASVREGLPVVRARLGATAGGSRKELLAQGIDALDRASERLKRSTEDGGTGELDPERGAHLRKLRPATASANDQALWVNDPGLDPALQPKDDQRRATQQLSAAMLAALQAQTGRVIGHDPAQLPTAKRAIEDLVFKAFSTDESFGRHLGNQLAFDRAEGERKRQGIHHGFGQVIRTVHGFADVGAVGVTNREVSRFGGDVVLTTVHATAAEVARDINQRKRLAGGEAIEVFAVGGDEIRFISSKLEHVRLFAKEFAEAIRQATIDGTAGNTAAARKPVRLSGIPVYIGVGKTKEEAEARSNAAKAGDEERVPGQLPPRYEVERSAQEALRAFNNPPHLRLGDDGLIVPDLQAPHAGQRAAWTRLEEKFGADSTRRLFDAILRGGAASAMRLMDQTRSPHTLTLGDLARLQFMALGDARAEGPIPVSPRERLHDAMHALAAYGISEFEEAQGDLHTDQLAGALLWRAGNLPHNDQAFLDTSAPLSRHPDTLREIDRLIRANYAELKNIAFELKINNALFRAEIDQTPRLDPRSLSAKAEAGAALGALNAAGLLTELNTDQRARLQSLLFSADRPGSYESIVERYAQHRDYDRFNNERWQWAMDVGELLRQAWQSRFLGEAQFHDKSLRAAAAAILVTRIAPHWQVDPQHEFASAPEAIDILDLRTAYPRVLQELASAMKAYQVVAQQAQRDQQAESARRAGDLQMMAGFGKPSANQPILDALKGTGLLKDGQLKGGTLKKLERVQRELATELGVAQEDVPLHTAALAAAWANWAERAAEGSSAVRRRDELQSQLASALAELSPQRLGASPIDVSTASELASFYQFSAWVPPRPELLRGMEAVRTATAGQRQALDLGSGAAVATGAMLANAGGFNVLAVDAEPLAQQYAQPLLDRYGSGRLQFVPGDISNAVLPWTDLVWAGFSLPYLGPHFARTWSGISNAILPGGVFAGDFFGNKHWRTQQPDVNSLAFHQRSEVQQLFAGFDLLELNEVEDQTHNNKGTLRTHTFNVVARKHGGEDAAAAAGSTTQTQALPTGWGMRTVITPAGHCTFELTNEHGEAQAKIEVQGLRGGDGVAQMVSLSAPNARLLARAEEAMAHNGVARVVVERVQPQDETFFSAAGYRLDPRSNSGGWVKDIGTRDLSIQANATQEPPTSIWSHSPITSQYLRTVWSLAGGGDEPAANTPILEALQGTGLLENGQLKDDAMTRLFEAQRDVVREFGLRREDVSMHAAALKAAELYWTAQVGHDDAAFARARAAHAQLRDAVEALPRPPRTPAPASEQPRKNEPVAAVNTDERVAAFLSGVPWALRTQ